MSTKNKKKPSPASHVSRPVSGLRWAYTLLFAFAVLLYANTLNHEFAFDDSVVITGNKYTLKGMEGIPDLVKRDLFHGIYGNSLDLEGGRWRPLTLVMFAVEYQLFGENATPYHVVNVLLYGLTAMALFMTLLQLLTFLPAFRSAGGELLAFITTLLFIAHPIHTEVVANIKSRDEIMSFLFLCLALYFTFRHIRAPGTKFIVYGVLCYFTALLSKENGITFIAIIPLTLLVFAGKNVKQVLLLTVPFFITAFIYLAIRTSLVGMIGDRESNDITDNPFLLNNFPDLPTEVPFFQKLATVFWILFKYLLLLIFPHPLTSDYGYNQIPVIGLTDPKAIIALLVLAGMCFYAFRVMLPRLKGGDINNSNTKDAFHLVIAYSVVFFLGTIVIVSNLFFLIGTTMGERFAFTSSLGFSLALAAVLLRVTNTSGHGLSQAALKHTKLALPLLFLLAPYSYKTLTRNPAWKNNKALFTTDVKTSTGSANAHYYYANTLFTTHLNDDPTPSRDSLFRAAMNEFRMAMSINPYFHYCYYNIGLIWEKLGNPDSSIVYHQKTIDLKPENTMAQYMAKGALGLVYGKLKGDAEKAMPLLLEAIAWKPEDPGYHENLGICYAMKGDYDNSIREFELGLKYKAKITKEDARVFMNLAISWQNKGDKAKSEEYFKKAFELDPSLKR